MRVVETVADAKFLKLKRVVDPENNVQGYIFAERLGKDSVAFICYDPNAQLYGRDGEFLINHEYTPPTGQYKDRAFGGSLDKNKNPKSIVADEVLEEAGYLIAASRVICVGTAFVSTQMNQQVFLFFVPLASDELGKAQYVGREPENAVEAMAEPRWVTEDDIMDGDDWKAIAILTKAKRKGLVE